MSFRGRRIGFGAKDRVPPDMRPPPLLSTEFNSNQEIKWSRLESEVEGRELPLVTPNGRHMVFKQRSILYHGSCKGPNNVYIK